MSRNSVLVVDDVPGFRITICEMMANLGFPFCVEAADGLEAFERAKEETPIIIISDFMMAPKTGIELLQMVKSDETLKQVPFILVSAVAERDVFEIALALGASGYIPRPIAFEVLKKVITETIGAAQ